MIEEKTGIEAKTNGDGDKVAARLPFDFERNEAGVQQARMEIAQRVVSGTLGASEAKAATQALDGIPKTTAADAAFMKARLEVIKFLEKASGAARDQASRLLAASLSDLKVLSDHTAEKKE